MPAKHSKEKLLMATKNKTDDGPVRFGQTFEDKKQSKVCPANTLRQPGEAYAVWDAIIPDSDWDAALNDAGYFSSVVARLHRFDVIRILNKSMTKEAECRILGLNEHLAKCELHVRQEFVYPRSTVGVSDPDDSYLIRNCGLDGWEILRKADGVTMAKELKTYDAALQRRRQLHENKLVA